MTTRHLLVGLFSFSVICLAGCTQHETETTIAMLAQGNAQGFDSYSGPGGEKHFITIETPAPNSRVSNTDFVLTGRCSIEGSLISIRILELLPPETVCKKGYWVLQIAEAQKIPTGHFQVFVSMKDKLIREMTAQRNYLKTE